MNGWNVDTLQRAVDECTNNSGRVEDCPVFQLYPDSVAEGCKLATRVTEDIQGPLSKLPGCNPVQKGPADAQIIKTCDGNNATIGEGKSFFKDLTSQGWSYQGCGADNYYSRALTGASTSQVGMTNEQCVKFCGDKGFSIAGTEYSKECYCSNSIPTAAQPVAGVVGNCNMPCSGDTNEFCGGSSLLSLYQKCTGATCANGGTAGSVKAGISSTTSVSITTKTTATTSIMVSSTKSSVTARSSISSPSYTTVASSTSTSPQATNPSSSLPNKWSYLSCVTDTLNPRTLPKLAPYTLENRPVTSTSCVSYCSVQGYTYAGTEYGGECWCGNNLSSSAQKLDASKCSMSCKGDGNQKCGGPAALSLFADLSRTNATTLVTRSENRDITNLVKEHMLQHGKKRHAMMIPDHGR